MKSTKTQKSALIDLIETTIPMTDPSSKEVGKYLKLLRENKKVSVRDVANAIGISNPYLYQVESGQKALIDPEKFHKLANYFGINVEELLKRAGYLPFSDPNKETDKQYQMILGAQNWENKPTEEIPMQLKKFIVEIFLKSNKTRLYKDSQSK